MESFYASLQKEHVHQNSFRTREEAKAAVFDYIEVFYNWQCLHSRIGYRTPVQARANMTEVSITMAA
jgi:putative transposase